MARTLNTILFVSLFILFGAASCNKKAVPVKSPQKTADFSDDLSKYRPRFSSAEESSGEGQEVLKNEAIVSQSDISEQLNVVLDTIASKNEALGLLQGYTILVYSGTSRTEADRIRNRLYDITDEEDIPIPEYALPTYFVKIGRFYEQIEAQQLYLQIRAFYPDATIVPQKFKAD